VGCGGDDALEGDSERSAAPGEDAVWHFVSVSGGEGGGGDGVAGFISMPTIRQSVLPFDYMTGAHRKSR
jgi:hypothetical protein